MTTIESRAELDRITGGDTMTLAGRTPEWDEWHTWPVRDRKRLERFMGGSLTPDRLATDLGCSVHEALREWRSACFVALDGGRADAIDAFEWEWKASLDALGEIVGPQEVADMFGVALGTVYQWRKRGLLPQAARVVSRTPLWVAATIEWWGLETGRLVREQAERF